MVVPIRPPKPGDEESQPSQKPVRPVVSDTDTPDLPHEKTTSFRGASLGSADEDRENEIAEKLAKLTRKLGNKSNLNPIYQDLTVEDLLVNDWERYEYLMPKVVAVKAWVTEVLQEQNRSTEIAEARLKRGHKYDEMYTLITSLLQRYYMSNRVVSTLDYKILSAMVANEILGLGPIEPLWRDNRISEIMVNGPYTVRIEMAGRLMDVPGVRFRDQEHANEVAQQILAPIGRSVDVSHPLADGSLVDGSRVNIVHPAIAEKGPYITIRRFPDTVFSLKELVKFGSMSEEMATDLGNLIGAGLSTVIIGGTGSGKTSTLNALSACIPPGERVLVIEDTSELRLHPDRDILYLQARPAQHEGSGAVTIRDLVKNALRMRPDRVVVGEVRDFAAYDMLQAMNTGHDGSMTTVHANDARSGIERLVNLLSEGGESAADSSRVLSLISSGVDLFVTIQRYEDGSRRCSGIYEIPNTVTVKDGRVSLEPVPLWEFVQDSADLDEDSVDGILKVTGHWERKNELSESMIEKKRLRYRERLTYEQICELAEQSSKKA
jgi:pilus assembly protein CpaF